MAGTDIKIPSSSGSDFDAYLAMPASGAGPGVVVAPAVHGVNQGIRDFTDSLAEAGCLAVALDLFWRTDPGPTPSDQGHLSF